MTRTKDRSEYRCNMDVGEEHRGDPHRGATFTLGAMRVVLYVGFCV